MGLRRLPVTRLWPIAGNARSLQTSNGNISQRGSPASLGLIEYCRIPC